ncbi:hypothetical protein BJX70DRAFT_361334 [Aspergillus crustosus]
MPFQEVLPVRGSKQAASSQQAVVPPAVPDPRGSIKSCEPSTSADPQSIAVHRDKLAAAFRVSAQADKDAQRGGNLNLDDSGNPLTEETMRQIDEKCVELASKKAEGRTTEEKRCVHCETSGKGRKYHKVDNGLLCHECYKISLEQTGPPCVVCHKALTEAVLDDGMCPACRESTRNCEMSELSPIAGFAVKYSERKTKRKEERGGGHDRSGQGSVPLVMHNGR